MISNTNNDPEEIIEEIKELVDRLKSIYEGREDKIKEDAYKEGYRDGELDCENEAD